MGHQGQSVGWSLVAVYGRFQTPGVKIVQTKGLLPDVVQA
jgi:hypothetical protein